VPTRYRSVRAATEALCEPLAIEDFGVQPMADASPAKWHLAHTTWFFETFLLRTYLKGYRVFHPRFEYLFNSYYQGLGQPFPRSRRGALSRPTVADVLAYRRHVDAAMADLLAGAALEAAIVQRLELGLHHEQQHQELLLTDLKYTLGTNPLLPAYRNDLASVANAAAAAATRVVFGGGIVWVGTDPGPDFCFDNETPRHRVLLRPFALADRLVTNAEYLAFIDDGGYRRPELWLSDGWDALTGMLPLSSRELAPAAEPQAGPLYWFRQDGAWHEYRLGGAEPLDMAAPVTHVSYYEADAYARWCGCRLPTEQEWEAAASGHPVKGNFADGGSLHPLPADGPEGGLRQLYGDVWEWTASPYVAYPGFRPLDGTLGEYNGKFMSNQLVLRGGSCASAPGHLRASYRNFFYPGDKWQFTGIRLASDV
jgi:ergothioneine biosynthesis protein EgtB